MNAGRGVTHLPMRGIAIDVGGSLLEMSSRKTDCARSTEMAIDVFSPPGGARTQLSPLVPEGPTMAPTLLVHNAMSLVTSWAMMLELPGSNPGADTCWLSDLGQVD